MCSYIFVFLLLWPNIPCSATSAVPLTQSQLPAQGRLAPEAAILASPLRTLRGNQSSALVMRSYTSYSTVPARASTRSEQRSAEGA